MTTNIEPHCWGYKQQETKGDCPTCGAPARHTTYRPMIEFQGRIIYADEEPLWRRLEREMRTGIPDVDE
jgi:hypothetical protein